MAQACTGKDVGSHSAALCQHTRHDGAQREAALLCADVVLDAVGRLAARELADEEAGQSVVEDQDVASAFRHSEAGYDALYELSALMFPLRNVGGTQLQRLPARSCIASTDGLLAGKRGSTKALAGGCVLLRLRAFRAGAIF